MLQRVLESDWKEPWLEATVQGTSFRGDKSLLAEVGHDDQKKTSEIQLQKR